MKKSSKKINFLLIIIPIILVIIGISILFVHSNDKNKFKYKIYDKVDMDYKFMNKGYYYEELGGGVYHYVITSGEKTTYGYSIDIDSVTKTDDKVKVIVHETSPDGIENSALTYPYVILELYENPKKIEIVDENGNSFERFN